MCDDNESCLAYTHKSEFNDCYLKGSRGNIKSNCKGWKTYEKISVGNIVCQRKNEEIFKEIADIKAIMNFLGS